MSGPIHRNIRAALELFFQSFLCRLLMHKLFGRGDQKKRIERKVSHNVGGVAAESRSLRDATPTLWLTAPASFMFSPSTTYQWLRNYTRYLLVDGENIRNDAQALWTVLTHECVARLISSFFLFYLCVEACTHFMSKRTVTGRLHFFTFY